MSANYVNMQFDGVNLPVPLPLVQEIGAAGKAGTGLDVLRQRIAEYLGEQVSTKTGGPPMIPPSYATTVSPVKQSLPDTDGLATVMSSGPAQVNPTVQPTFEAAPQAKPVTGPEPTTRVTVRGDFGTWNVPYHAAVVSNGNILLVYDNRYTQGITWLPPEAKAVMVDGHRALAPTFFVSINGGQPVQVAYVGITFQLTNYTLTVLNNVTPAAPQQPVDPYANQGQASIPGVFEGQ